MIRAVVSALVLSAFLGCGGGAPKRTNHASDYYVIKSVVADPSGQAFTVVISIDSHATETDVKTAAEKVIAEHKSQYPSITVKTHLMSADGSGLPYAISVFDGAVITHSFNPQSAPEKIRTH